MSSALETLVWSSIWCKTIPFAWDISPKVMNSLLFQHNRPCSFVYRHNSNSDVTWPRRNYLRNGRLAWSMVHTGDMCLHHVLHLPNVPTITEHEHDYCLLGSSFECAPCHPFMGSDCEIQVWNSGSDSVDDFSLLDPQCGSAFVHYVCRLQADVEGFLTLGLQGYLACFQTIYVVWCYALVKNITSKYEFLIRNLFRCTMHL